MIQGLGHSAVYGFRKSAPVGIFGKSIIKQDLSSAREMPWVPCLYRTLQIPLIVPFQGDAGPMFSHTARVYERV